MATKRISVKVYVEGELYHETTNPDVPDWAVPYVAEAAIVQVDEPDLEGAKAAVEDPEPMQVKGLTPPVDARDRARRG